MEWRIAACNAFEAQNAKNRVLGVTLMVFSRLFNVLFPLSHLLHPVEVSLSLYSSIFHYLVRGRFWTVCSRESRLAANSDIVLMPLTYDASPCKQSASSRNAAVKKEINAWVP